MLNQLGLLYSMILMENKFVHVKHSMKDLLVKMTFVIEIVLMLSSVLHITWLLTNSILNVVMMSVIVILDILG
jgi:uncharacterized membrane protein